MIFTQKFKKPEAEVKRQLIIIVSVPRSSAVAKRPRDAPCHFKILLCDSKSFTVTRTCVTCATCMSFFIFTVSSTSNNGMSLKSGFGVIGNATIRQIAQEFLFVFHCNYGPVLLIVWKSWVLSLLEVQARNTQTDGKATLIAERTM